MTKEIDESFKYILETILLYYKNTFGNHQNKGKDYYDGYEQAVIDIKHSIKRYKIKGRA